MDFISPHSLLALLTVPVVVWLYARAVRRGRAESFVLHPQIALVARVARAGSWGRRLGVGLYALGLSLALFALARPKVLVMVTDSRAGVILAMDISGSMDIKDVRPNRLEAAKIAARKLIEELPAWVKVGLVSFSEEAVLNAPLSADRADIAEKIHLLQTGAGTAIGRGLMTSIKAVPLDENGRVSPSAIVVLLSDGQSQEGLNPMVAAKQAARLGLKVYTVGVGKLTEGGLDFDETALREIARATGGRYYAVGSASRLSEVYSQLGNSVGWERRSTEVTGGMALGAGLLLASSLFLGQLSRRVV